MERWTLIRDAIAFQGKLFLDGIRDFLMGPIAIGLAVLDLLGVSKRTGALFYPFLRWGRRTEEWIGLFSAVEGPDELGTGKPAQLDRVLERMEGIVRREYERGGMTASAKQAVDRALDSLH